MALQTQETRQNKFNWVNAIDLVTEIAPVTKEREVVNILTFRWLEEEQCNKEELGER